jgi:hypothetical protein
VDLDNPSSPDVVAMHLDSEAILPELAQWCGGRVDELDGQAVLTLTTSRGIARARHDDWIVRIGKGEYAVMSPEEFAARAEPASDLT